MARSSRPRRRPFLPYLLRTLGTCALLVTVFYLAPVEQGAHGTRLAWRAVLAVVGVLAIAVLIGREVRQLVAAELEGDPDRPAGNDRTHLTPRARRTAGAASSLIVALFAGLIMFAFVDFLVATSGTDQFAGLDTKTDALYFAVSTLTTVGYGDIHATGQLARVVVICQQLFNLAVLATGASVLLSRLKPAAAR